jgi:protein CpxP
MDTHTTTKRFPRRYGWWLLAIPVLALGGFGIARAQGLGGGPGCGMMMGGGPGGDHAGFFAKHLDRMLDRVKATDAQRAAIKPIVADLQAKLKPLHQRGAGIHDKLMDAFAAETIDAGVVASLRQEGLRLHDEGAQLVTDALVKIGGQLTVEQRQQVIAQLKEHRPRHRFGR